MKLTYVVGPIKLVCIDFELSHEKGGIVTKNQFKPTMQFILTLPELSPPLMEKQHPSCSVQQIRNCSKVEDYIKQSQVLINKFVEKGYPLD